MNNTSILYVLLLLLAVGLFVLWVWTLVSAARNGRWVWFVLIFLCGALSLPYVLYCWYLMFADKGPPGQREQSPLRREPTFTNGP